MGQTPLRMSDNTASGLRRQPADLAMSRGDFLTMKRPEAARRARAD